MLTHRTIQRRNADQGDLVLGAGHIIPRSRVLSFRSLRENTYLGRIKGPGARWVGETESSFLGSRFSGKVSGSLIDESCGRDVWSLVSLHFCSCCLNYLMSFLAWGKLL